MLTITAKNYWEPHMTDDYSRPVTKKGSKKGVFPFNK
jgi:hypothetical protein